MRTLRGRQHDIDGGKDAGAVALERIEGAGGGQAFEHPLVKQPQVDVFAKLKDVVEAAQLLARRQHRLDGSLSHVLDRSEAKADTLTRRRESMIARIDVGRQDTDSHVAAFIQVKR